MGLALRHSLSPAFVSPAERAVGRLTARKQGRPAGPRTAGQRFPPRDQNIVIAGEAIKGKQRRSRGPASRRLARLRSTAPPSFLVAVNPTRKRPAWPTATEWRRPPRLWTARPGARRGRHAGNRCVFFEAIHGEGRQIHPTLSWPAPAAHFRRSSAGEIRPKASCGRGHAGAKAVAAFAHKACSADRCASWPKCSGRGQAGRPPAEPKGSRGSSEPGRTCQREAGGQSV
jgi:hypothetical protein